MDTLSDVLGAYGCQYIEPMELYSKVFQFGNGYIQKKNEAPGEYKANPIAYYKNNNEVHGHFRILFEDEFKEIYINELSKADFAIMNGITYFGSKYLSSHSSKMFAMIFDLDGVDKYKLMNFLNGAKSGVYPTPNYLCLSGHGVHLYYVFKKPIDLYPFTKIELKKLKYELIKKIWNKYTSNEEKIQYQGINQPFRVVGGKTKKGSSISRTLAFKVSENLYTIEQLAGFVDEKFDFGKHYKSSVYSLEEAKKLFPVWYDRVVLKKEPKKYWTVNTKLYEWWYRRICKEASVGHRYFCIMCLAIYAIKCGVSFEKLKDDAYKLIPVYNSLDVLNPFTVDDVNAALECYDLRYCTFPRRDISKISGLEIVPNKRVYNSRANHLYLMRSKKKSLKELNLLKHSEGRPNKAVEVKNWRMQNPNGTKYQCIKETKLSKMTVYKWWDSL